MTWTVDLAAFAAAAQPEPALGAVVAFAVADCFGCILAGADSDVATLARRALTEGAAGAAPIYGAGARLGLGAAALCNAVAGHAYDLDDWEEPGNTHPTVVMLPALLAAAALRPVSGAQLFAAYAVGFEIICRLGEAMTLDHYTRGFHATATLGAVGAAGAVSRALGLTQAQTACALSLAASQATGYTLHFASNAKPLQAGFAARAGLEAALLAQVGATAQTRALEDPRGFAGLMGVVGRPLKPLGDPWALAEYGIVLKPWASCGYTHRVMTAALALRGRFGGTSEIVAIRGAMPDFHKAILPFERPANRTEAMFSAPASIAQALVAGGLKLADGEARFWERPEVARLIAMTRIDAEPARNPALNYDPDQPDRLEISLASGETLKTVCAYPLGAPQNPMKPAQLSEKFAAVTGRPAAAFDRLLAWPEAPDIGAFLKEFEPAWPLSCGDSS